MKESIFVRFLTDLFNFHRILNESQQKITWLILSSTNLIKTNNFCSWSFSQCLPSWYVQLYLGFHRTPDKKKERKTAPWCAHIFIIQFVEQMAMSSKCSPARVLWTELVAWKKNVSNIDRYSKTKVLTTRNCWLQI